MILWVFTGVVLTGLVGWTPLGVYLYKNCVRPFLGGFRQGGPARWAHLEVGIVYFYGLLLPFVKGLPAWISGFFYLHYIYGSAYFKWRLTLIGVVDNFKIVPLHAVGYLTWRAYWRGKLYPRLVRRFPWWGHFTSVEIWLNHWVTEHKLLRGGVLKFKHLYTRSTRWRYTANGYHPHRVGVTLARWAHLAGQVGRYPTTPVGVGVLSPRDNPNQLHDGEWLTLENAFPEGTREPFQELLEDYFDAQQDDSYMEDDEPNNPEDTLFGTRLGEDDDDPLSEMTGLYGRYRYRRNAKKLMKHKTYRRVSHQVVNFVPPSEGWSTSRVIPGGDGPNVQDTEDTPRDNPPYRWYHLADWYFFLVGTKNLSDRRLHQTQFGEVFRHNRRAWPSGLLYNLGRPYQRARLFGRWLRYDRKTHRRRFYVRFKGYYRERPRRRPFKPRVRGGTFSVRFKRKFWDHPRWARKSPWTEGSYFMMFRYSLGLRKQFYRSAWYVQAVFKRLSHGVPGLPHRTDQVHRDGLHSRRHPRGWYFDTIRPAEPLSGRRGSPRVFYPGWQPLYTQSRNLATLTSPVRLPPTGGVTLVVTLVVTLWFHLIWTDSAAHPVWLEYAFPTITGWEPSETHWVQDWAGQVLPGVPTWFEILREAPPRGWRSWPGNPGVDGNLYVWSYWADLYMPRLQSGLEFSMLEPDMVTFSTWKWFFDSPGFSEVWPPHISSWAHLQPGWTDRFNQHHDMWIPQPPTQWRRIDTSMFTPYELGFTDRANPEYDMQGYFAANLEAREEGKVVYPTVVNWAREWGTLWMSQLANPVWVNPRWSPEVVPRWVTFWEDANVYYNWMSEYYLNKMKPLTHGGVDENVALLKEMEDSSPRWTTLNVPTPWELQGNAELIREWRAQSVEGYTRTDSGLYWTGQLEWLTRLDVPGWAYPTGRVWFYLVGPVAFLWNFKGWNIKTLFPPGAVTVYPTHRSGRVGPGRVRPTRPGREYFSDYGRLYYNVDVHVWGVPNNEGDEVEPERDWSYRWYSWSDYFSTARTHFNGVGPNLKRKAHPAGLVKVLTPAGNPQRGNFLPGRVRSTSAVGWAILGAHPTKRTLRESWGVTFRGVPHGGDTTWLVRPERVESPVVGPNEVGRRHRRRSNSREDDWLMRRLTQDGGHFGQYKRRRKRRTGWLRRRNTVNTTRLFSNFRSTPRVNPPRWGTPPVWVGRAVQHGWGVIRYRKTIRIHPVGALTPLSRLFLGELARVDHPGRGGPLCESTGIALSQENGYDVQVYEDDQNQVHMGPQGDEDYEEFEDFEDPWGPSFREVKYLTPGTTQLVTPRLTQVGTPQKLIAYKRFCALPLGCYRCVTPGTYLTLETDQSVMGWSTFGVDHPAFQGVYPYVVPRLFRRLTRWGTGRVEFDLPGRARVSLGEPWRESYRVDFSGVTPRGNLKVVGHPHRYRRGSLVGPWKNLEVTQQVAQVYSPVGGDLLWPTLVDTLRDELYTTGWVLWDLTARDGDWVNDDVDTLEVGHPGGGLGYRGGYGGVYFRPWTTPGRVQSCWPGWNGNRYLLGETLSHPNGVDPEGTLLEVAGQNYLEGHTFDTRYIEGYAFQDRFPEDVVDAPNDGEQDEEICEPTPMELPGWMVAAAVAGASPGQLDPTALSDRLGDQTSTSAEVDPLGRVNALFIQEYYREWLRDRPKRDKLFRVQPEQFFPFPEMTRMEWLTLRDTSRVALIKAELSELTGAGHDRLGRDLTTREHLRLWALTEVYYGDAPHGRFITV